MQHAFAITAYRDPASLQALLVQIMDIPGARAYCHIDSRRGEMIKVMQDWLANSVDAFRQRIYFQYHYPIRWASSDHLNVQIELTKKALDDGADYFHTLTGQCRLVQSAEFFSKFFEENKDFSFMESFSLLDKSCPWSNGVTRAERIKHYQLFDVMDARKTPRLFKALNNQFLKAQKLIGVDRVPKILQGGRPYGGLSYWSIQRAALEGILNDPIIVDHRYKHTFCAEEVIPMTVLSNALEQGKLANVTLKTQTLRYIDWGTVHGESPGILDQRHLQNICNPVESHLPFPYIFARKIDSTISQELLQQLNARASI